MGYIVKMSSGELYHHGILGQKWGHRQGPPYPLDASDHSASERKTGWHKSLSAVKKVAKTVRNIDEDLSRGKGGQNHAQSIKKANSEHIKSRSDLKKVASDAKNDVKAKAKTINKEKVVKAAKIGATVAATGLAAYGAYKVAKSGILANQRASARQQMRALTRMGVDAHGTNFAALNRNANAARRVGLEIVNYNQRAQEAAVATRAISRAIDRGEQSTLAIFDNLTNGHNSLHSTDNLVRSGNSNRLASEGEWLLEELLKG